VSGGVWKTTNGGKRWKAAGTGLANIAVNSMAMHPRDRNTLYVGTGEGYFREDIRGTGLPLRGGGIFRTSDGGSTWQFLESTGGEDFWFVNDLVFSPDGGRIYAATRTGLWRSGDAGDSWKRILNPGVTGGCLDLAMRTDRTDDVLFASCGTFTQATVYRSDNAAARSVGRAVRFVPVLRDPGMGRTSIAIAPSNQDIVYALAASNRRGSYEQALHAVFRSTEGGDKGSWEARVRNTDPAIENTLLLHNAVSAVSETCGFGANGFVPMGWYVNTLAVDPVDPEVVWAAGVDWFRSDDGGRNWGPASFWWARGQSQSYAHSDQHALAFHPGYGLASNQTLFVAGDGGVFRTRNALAAVGSGLAALCDPGSSAVTWRSLNKSLEITQFYFGLPYPGGGAYLGGAQDNGTLVRPSDRNTNGWLPVYGGDGGYVAIDPRNPNVIYVESQWAGLQKSVDGGFNFASATAGLPDGDGHSLDPDANFVFITPFVMDPNDPDTLWIGGRVVYRTVDGADSWHPASRGLKGRASAISVAPSDSERVAVGTEIGFIYTNDAAGSTGPQSQWPAKRPRKAWVTWVAHDPSDADVIYATYGGFGGSHVYRSVNGGQSWRSIDGDGELGLPDIPVHSLIVDPDDGDRLFIGTDLGVFVTTDGGATWAQENAGFGNIVTESLALQTEGAKLVLYAFTHGRGAWRAAVKRVR